MSEIKHRSTYVPLAEELPTKKQNPEATIIISSVTITAMLGIGMTLIALIVR